MTVKEIYEAGRAMWLNLFRAGELWLILFSGVVLGMLLIMSLRWIGKRLSGGNQQKEGGGVNRR